MKKTFLVFLGFSLFITSSMAQGKDDEGEETKGFKKENLFTGGSLSLGLGFGGIGNTFTIGASPVFGYSINNWLDAGLVVNYIYSSSEYEDNLGDRYKAKISNYGGGAFAKIYPFQFLFLQTQFEHNFSTQKSIPQNGNPSSIYRYSANSLLLGAGYAGGRDPFFKTAFFNIAILFDVLGDPYSPYTNSDGTIVPNVVAGLQIPLFQGRGDRDRY
jgi:hypothetical protein